MKPKIWKRRTINNCLLKNKLDMKLRYFQIHENISSIFNKTRMYIVYIYFAQLNFVHIIEILRAKSTNSNSTHQHNTTFNPLNQRLTNVYVASNKQLYLKMRLKKIIINIHHFYIHACLTNISNIHPWRYHNRKFIACDCYNICLVKVKCH